MKKHFYIFRHGQTVWNAEGRPQGQHEYPVPLTMEGREQAQKLADKLKGKKIKLIVSSDLLRAEVYPDFKKCYEDPKIPFPEGESLHQVALRFIDAVKDICSRCSYRAVGISSHGHAITSLIEEVFGYQVQRVENCDYVHITYDPVKDKFEGVELPPE